MRAYTPAEKARMTYLSEEILAGTNYGTLRELSYQLKELQREQIPLSELTNIMDAITSGKGYEYKAS